ncbi:MAG: hypothetical protein EOQ50_04005 [Mesorhizobium sp.]|nr:MAG: hypothetical protein EOQ50_04005 [Mesorhizobium sp.]
MKFYSGGYPPWFSALPVLTDLNVRCAPVLEIRAPAGSPKRVSIRLQCSSNSLHPPGQAMRRFLELIEAAVEA